jgi:hypothetical protein
MSSLRCHVVAWLAVFCINISAHALNISNSTEQISAKQLDALAWDSRWLGLLHVRPETRRKNRFETYIDDAKFFLTGGSRLDPKLELIATLEHFQQQPESQCQYTGRRYWLGEVLPDFAASLPQVECEKYLAWLQAIDAKSVTLVFAASYLNSPSSMYGHTFLRVDSQAENRNVAYLSQAINFAAKVEEKDNGFLYSFKGLAGGYPGLFSMLPYHQKLKEYSRMENRDIWEYELNLSEQEIHRMLSHVWELEYVEFDYFFFDENCSFRLLELFEVARPSVELTDGFSLYAIPIDTVRAVEKVGLISRVSVRPSAQRALSYQINNLEPAEREQVASLVDDQGDPAILRSNPPDRIGDMASVASNYWRYRYKDLPREQRGVKKQLELLRTVNQYVSAEQNSNEENPEKSAVEGLVQSDKGHKTELVAISMGEFDKDLYTQLEWRISYHDLLDDGRGYPEGVSLNIGRLQLRLDDDGSSRLQRFDLIEITSLAPRDDFFKPVSWRVNAGWERVFVGDSPLVSQVNGGGGMTKRLATGVNAFAFLNGRIEYSSQLQNDVDAGLGVSMGLHVGKKNKMMLSLEQWKLTAAGDERYASNISYNWSLGINHALRMNWQHRWFESQEINDVSLGYRYYF